MGRVDVVAADVAEQEIGYRRACVSAVEGELAARGARLAESHAAIVELATELKGVAPLLPRESIGERRNGVGAYARADLALQIVHVVHAVGSTNSD